MYNNQWILSQIWIAGLANAHLTFNSYEYHPSIHNLRCNWWNLHCCCNIHPNRNISLLYKFYHSKDFKARGNWGSWAVPFQACHPFQACSFWNRHRRLVLWQSLTIPERLRLVPRFLQPRCFHPRLKLGWNQPFRFHFEQSLSFLLTFLRKKFVFDLIL